MKTAMPAILPCTMPQTAAPNNPTYIYKGFIQPKINMDNFFCNFFVHYTLGLIKNADDSNFFMNMGPDSNLKDKISIMRPIQYECMVYSAEDIYESIFLQWVNYILGLIKMPMTATVFPVHVPRQQP